MTTSSTLSPLAAPASDASPLSTIRASDPVHAAPGGRLDHSRLPANVEDGMTITVSFPNGNKPDYDVKPHHGDGENRTYTDQNGYQFDRTRSGRTSLKFRMHKRSCFTFAGVRFSQKEGFETPDRMVARLKRRHLKLVFDFTACANQQVNVTIYYMDANGNVFYHDPQVGNDGGNQPAY